MSITRKTLSVVIILSIILCTMTACFGNNNQSTVENESSSELYEDYSFWEQENQLRFFIPLVIKGEHQNSETFNEIGNLELPKTYKDRTDILKQAMISYFKDKYSLDITSKLSTQKLKVFSSMTFENEMTMGYVNPEKPEFLNLNQRLFDDYSYIFDNTYIHETLHQIGFISKTPSIMDEGIADALTDLILKNLNIEFFPTESYYLPRALAYQILEVDTDIAKFYLDSDNSQIEDRINKKLKNVHRPFEEQDAGEFLIYMISGLMNGVSGTVDPYYVAFQAQEIVRAYCQTFNPSHESIDKIRSNYIVKKYEKISIVAEDDRYSFVYE